MRTSISSDLHDEVGATLTSISLFSELAKQSVNSNTRAEQYLHRIGERSRDSIEKMGDIVWSINPENDSLQQMLVRMKNYANEICETTNCAVNWNDNGNITSLKLSMSQRKNFYLLFKEAITNAAKYSGAKNITVQLSAGSKLISLKVIDDGKGFSFESIKPGNGIKNIRHRAKLLNGTATIESFPGKGTTVYVQFHQ